MGIVLVDGGVREELARALYTDHLVRAAARGVVDPAWAELSDDEREAAREAVPDGRSAGSWIGLALLEPPHVHQAGQDDRP